MARHARPRWRILPHWVDVIMAFGIGALVVLIPAAIVLLLLSMHVF